MKPKKIENSVYSLHPSYEHQQSIIENLKEKTGRDLAEWLKVLKGYDPEDMQDGKRKLIEWQSLSSGRAAIVSGVYFGESGEESYHPEKLVDAQYAKKNPALRDIYNLLLEKSFSLGEDVQVAPVRTYVPVFRNNVIAQIKPATKDRIDFGLALGDHAEEGRLKQVSDQNMGDRITHKIELKLADDVDEEVEKYLRKAYEIDG